MYNGEVCRDCGLPASHGIGVTFWNAPNDLWNLVLGGPDATDDPGGVLCCACFWRLCREQGIHISWRAEVYAERSQEKNP